MSLSEAHKALDAAFMTKDEAAIDVALEDAAKEDHPMTQDLVQRATTMSESIKALRSRSEDLFRKNDVAALEKLSREIVNQDLRMPLADIMERIREFKTYIEKTSTNLAKALRDRRQKDVFAIMSEFEGKPVPTSATFSIIYDKTKKAIEKGNQYTAIADEIIAKKDLEQARATLSKIKIDKAVSEAYIRLDTFVTDVTQYRGILRQALRDMDEPVLRESMVDIEAKEYAKCDSSPDLQLLIADAKQFLSQVDLLRGRCDAALESHNENDIKDMIREISRTNLEHVMLGDKDRLLSAKKEIDATRALITKAGMSGDLSRIDSALEEISTSSYHHCFTREIERAQTAANEIRTGLEKQKQEEEALITVLAAAMEEKDIPQLSTFIKQSEFILTKGPFLLPESQEYLDQARDLVVSLDKKAREARIKELVPMIENAMENKALGDLRKALDAVNDLKMPRKLMRKAQEKLEWLTHADADIQHLHSAIKNENIESVEAFFDDFKPELYNDDQLKVVKNAKSFFIQYQEKTVASMISAGNLEALSDYLTVLKSKRVVHLGELKPLFRRADHALTIAEKVRTKCIEAMDKMNMREAAHILASNKEDYGKAHWFQIIETYYKKMAQQDVDKIRLEAFDALDRKDDALAEDIVQRIEFRDYTSVLESEFHNLTEFIKTFQEFAEELTQAVKRPRTESTIRSLIDRVHAYTRNTKDSKHVSGLMEEATKVVEYLDSFRAQFSKAVSEKDEVELRRLREDMVSLSYDDLLGSELSQIDAFLTLIDYFTTQLAVSFDAGDLDVMDRIRTEFEEEEFTELSTSSNLMISYGKVCRYMDAAREYIAEIEQVLQSDNAKLMSSTLKKARNKEFSRSLVQQIELLEEVVYKNDKKFAEKQRKKKRAKMAQNYKSTITAALESYDIDYLLEVEQHLSSNDLTEHLPEEYEAFTTRLDTLKHAHGLNDRMDEALVEQNRERAIELSFFAKTDIPPDFFHLVQDKWNELQQFLQQSKPAQDMTLDEIATIPLPLSDDHDLESSRSELSRVVQEPAQEQIPKVEQTEETAVEEAAVDVDIDEYRSKVTEALGSVDKEGVEDLIFELFGLGLEETMASEIVQLEEHIKEIDLQKQRVFDEKISALKERIYKATTLKEAQLVSDEVDSLGVRNQLGDAADVLGYILEELQSLEGASEQDKVLISTTSMSDADTFIAVLVSAMTLGDEESLRKTLDDAKSAFADPADQSIQLRSKIADAQQMLSSIDTFRASIAKHLESKNDVELSNIKAAIASSKMENALSKDLEEVDALLTHVNNLSRDIISAISTHKIDELKQLCQTVEEESLHQASEESNIVVYYKQAVDLLQDVENYHNMTEEALRNFDKDLANHLVEDIGQRGLNQAMAEDVSRLVRFIGVGQDTALAIPKMSKKPRKSLSDLQKKQDASNAPRKPRMSISVMMHRPQSEEEKQDPTAAKVSMKKVTRARQHRAISTPEESVAEAEVIDTRQYDMEKIKKNVADLTRRLSNALMGNNRTNLLGVWKEIQQQDIPNLESFDDFTVLRKEAQEKVDALNTIAVRTQEILAKSSEAEARELLTEIDENPWFRYEAGVLQDLLDSVEFYTEMLRTYLEDKNERELEKALHAVESKSSALVSNAQELSHQVEAAKRFLDDVTRLRNRAYEAVSEVNRDTAGSIVFQIESLEYESILQKELDLLRNLLDTEQLEEEDIAEAMPTIPRREAAPPSRRRKTSVDSRTKRKMGLLKPEIKRLFNAFDEDNDGSISKSEFMPFATKYVTALNNFENPDKVAESLYESLDTDKSGQLSLAEFWNFFNAKKLMPTHESWDATLTALKAIGVDTTSLV